MDFMLALNVTIYGLGIVFLALLVLMFAIMILTKLFSVATGHELLRVPTAGPGGTATSIPAEANVVVAEHPPMAPGAVAAVVPAPERPAAPVPGVAAATFGIAIGGREYQAEVMPGPSGTTRVVLDGAGFEVQRDSNDAKRFYVGGRPHVVEVKESGAGGAVIVVDGAEQRVDVHGPSVAAVAAAAVPALGAGVFKVFIGSAEHHVEVKDVSGKSATIVVNGVSFQVDRTNGKSVLVSGKPHTVEVKERSGASVGVLIDGLPQMVQLVPEAGAAAEKTAAVSAPAPVPPAAPVAAAAPAASVAPAVAPVPTMPAPAAAGERVVAPLPGKVLSMAVRAGDVVRKGDELCVIEAMKMGNSIKAQRDGTVQEVFVSAGDPVVFGTPLLVIG